MEEILARIIAQIDGVESVKDEDALRRLDEAINELFRSAHPEQGIDAMFRVFERFPTEDGFGVFWSILHGLESLSGHYEEKLIDSLRRSPSEFSVRMVNRLLNVGTKEVGRIALLPLLQEVSKSETCPTEVRESAKRLTEHQLGNA